MRRTNNAVLALTYLENSIRVAKQTLKCFYPCFTYWINEKLTSCKEMYIVNNLIKEKVFLENGAKNKDMRLISKIWLSNAANLIMSKVLVQTVAFYFFLIQS